MSSSREGREGGDIILKCNSVTLPPRNELLFVVTSKDFITFKIAVISNCNGAITVKNGNEFRLTSYFTGNGGTLQLYKSNGPITKSMYTLT